MTAQRPEQPTPDYVPAHNLLNGKVVVVTAAAGAGIGASVVRRVLEEGASAVVLGDTHERRLAEAQEELSGEFGADRVRSLVCDVTNEEQVKAPRRRGRRVRWRRHHDQQCGARWHRLRA
ncbi:MAG: SDR family NAD(P)-dependent oxidoreductase [Marmoricola sp.]